MLLHKVPADGWTYHVQSRKWQIHCYVWPRGALLPARIRHSSLSNHPPVDVMATDKGKLRVLTYELTTKTSE